MVFTGPESTAKSSLAIWVSNYYKYRLIPEYSREYLYRNGPEYDCNDVVQMAVKQHDMSLVGLGGGGGQVEDCDLLTYLVWLGFKYGDSDVKIHQLWMDHLPDLYLLCAPDISWREDPLREHPNERGKLFSIYLNFLTQARAPFRIITGNASQRISKTIFHIETFRKGIIL